MKQPVKLVLALGLVGVLSGLLPAFAQQTTQKCPLPAGVAANPLATPSVTAADNDLMGFALAAKRYLASIRPGPELVHSACLLRQDGPWKSGSNYVVTMSTDGRVYFHSANAALSGKPLKPAVWGAIAAATGAADLRTTGNFGKPNGGPLPAQIGGGYAVGFKRTVGGATFILVAGLDLQESHVASETVDPGDPKVRADQVVDRATLKSFVKGAKDYLIDLYRSEGRSAFTKAKSVFREPNGRWRHGPIYLFVMETTGYTVFHGAFPDKYEFQTPTNTLRDAVTGKLILPQIIQAATANADGGFVRYHFDNPDDDTDSATTPKVTYAIQHVFQTQRADGSTLEYKLIFGAGIYGDPLKVPEDVCPRPSGVAVNPLEKPGVTAAQVATGAGSVGDFALAARKYFDSITSPEELGYAGCITRNAGPWKAGSTYLASLSLSGRVILHAGNMALGGKKLNPVTYAGILAALGIPVDPANPDATMAALRKVAETGTFPNSNGGPVPVTGGYAVGYGIEFPYILLAGVDLQDSDFAPETLDPGDPEISADEVVDRRTLKLFVNGAIDYLLELQRTNPTEIIPIVRSVMRGPPWKHGPVYLFVMDTNGYTHLHGGFPDRFEFQKPTDTLRDAVTGKLILPQIIEAAQSNLEEGGFVEYYFDDPNDDSDSADVPKVTYARQFDYTLNFPGAPPMTHSLIVGAGIYPDRGAVSEESVAATRGWLGRFGRAVASQAVEMISDRMNSPTPSGPKLTLGGQSVNLDGDWADSPARDGAGFDSVSLAQNDGDSRAFARWRSADGLPLGGDESRGTYRGMTLSELLTSSSFLLASAKGAEGAPGGRWSMWGGASRTSFGGGGAVALEGDVTTAMLGVDYGQERILGGVALSRASGEGGFRNEGRSEIETTLTSVHPYLRLVLNERVTGWGILGWGQGEMTLDDEGSGMKVATDIEMQMGALGVRGELANMGGFDLAVKSDVLLAQVESDAKDGLESISAEATRLRVMIEASRELAMQGRGRLRPSVEAGLRRDGGDVDEGTGVEVGGGVRFTNPAAGLTMELRARGLVAHEEKDVTDWGIGGRIRIDPGEAGRGLALTVQPAIGDTASGVGRLWGIEDASRLANDGVEELDPRARAEVGYGLEAWGGLLTPYAGLSVSEGGGETYRLGGRFKVGSRMSMSIEGDVRERANAGPAHGVALRGSVRW